MRRWTWLLFCCLIAAATACGGCKDENNGEKNNPNSMAESCEDVTCADDATCDDSDGQAVCTCLPGFEGDGFSCEEITVACSDDGDCGTNGQCVDELCECGEGYALEADGCADADECATNIDDCADNATCTNTPGSYLCSCNAGFQGDGTSCSDFDECAAGADDCTGENVACVNIDGGFECGCADGYTGDGRTCSLLVDCNSDPGACDANASCTDTDDGTACVCNVGFSGDGASCRQTGFDIIRAGRNATCGLRRDGTMSCWGANVPGASSQAFYGNIATQPVDNPTGAVWSDLGTGLSNWCAVLESDKTLWCYENGTFSQVGTETGWAMSAGSTDVFDSTHCAIKEDGTLWCWGDNDGYQLGMGRDPMGDTSVPQQVGTDTDWMTVDLGEDNACALKTNRTMWCWGDGANGSYVEQPEQVSDDVDWDSLVVSDEDYCGRKVNGQVWCATRYGASDGLERVEPVLWRSYDHTRGRACGVREDGTLWCRGGGQFGEHGSDQVNNVNFVQVGNDSDWQFVALGSLHTCALKESGAAWCFGSNLQGELGIGTLPYRFEPARVDAGTAYRAVDGGLASTCALRANGALACAGANFAGQALLPRSTYAVQRFTTVGNSTGWTDISMGLQHLCAIQGNGALWCGGFNGGGQVGVGMNAYPEGLARIGTDTDWASVAMGPVWSLALKDDGSLYGWGLNESGQLGLGDTEQRWTPERVGTDSWKQVAAGGPGNNWGHGCGIQSDDTLWCWGSNNAYQVGNGTTDNVLAPTQVGTDTWESVTVGSQYSCAINAAGELWCWGGGGIWGQQQMVPTQVNPDTDWETAVAGEFHICGIKTGGSLWCWGQGTNGQLGQGVMTVGVVATPSRVGTQSNWMSIGLGTRSTHAIQADGSLWAWGDNQSGQLGTGDAWSPTPVPVLD